MNREAFKELLFHNIPQTEGKRLVVWGAGNTAQLYAEGLERLEKEGFFIHAYCDNDPKKYGGGQKCNGKEIISPSQLKNMENICVLICSPRPEVISAVKEQVTGMKLECYLLDEVILKQHAERLLECYDLLEDEESRNVYANIILSHIQGTCPAPEFRCGNPYFAIDKFMTGTPDEVFVDCGAYVGDSIERYIWERYGVVGKIIAFEPDSGSSKALKKRIDRLKDEWNLKDEQFCAYSYGIGDKENMGIFSNYDNNNGLGSKFSESGENPEEGTLCRIVSLDQMLGERYTFLKADIESYEYKMLLGAKEGIRKWKPLLAICIYHNAVDLYSIPLLIKKLEANYKMAVRHHSASLADTVLYCWI